MSRPPRPMKYNPGFLSEQELRANFVVRDAELELVLEALRDDTSGASQHQLIVGPRGSGKSTLVQRVAAELRSDPELSARYLPIVFSEESYEVDSAGGLWLEALGYLARQLDDARLRGVHEQLRRERDRERLRQLSLSELHAVAEAQSRRLVLIVENLHMLLTEQISQDEAWTLRHTLLGDRSIVLLTTAATRFAAIDAPDQAMYELLRVVPLEPLTSTECATVWTHLTGQAADERQGRALEILTGGNLRLLTILSTFGADAPLATTLENLTRLIDDHTDFFKSNIESLPAGERRVFAALADQWAPSTASSLAELLRADVSLVSAQLARLEQRGVVAASGSPRRKRYQLTERLYNIYFLLRRHGRGAERVQVVIDFIAAYYSPDALVEHLIGFATRALDAGSEQQRELHQRAFYRLYNKLADTHAATIVARLPSGFLEQPDLPSELRADLTRRGEAVRAGEEQIQVFFRELRGAVTLFDAIVLPEAPGIQALLAFALNRGEGTAPASTPAIDPDAVRREVDATRTAILRACEEVLARSSVTYADLAAIVVLALLLRAPALSCGAFERLTAPIADNPYVRLLVLLLKWSGDLAPAKFAARAERLIREHPDHLFLPLVAGALVFRVGLHQRAAEIFSRARFMARLEPLADACAGIYQDIRDEEEAIVLEPRVAFLVPLLRADAWEPLFTALAVLADPLSGRAEDAVEILRHGLRIAPTNFSLQMQLAWRLHHRVRRFDDARDVLGAALANRGDDWRGDLLTAILHVDPRRDLEAALPLFLRSWSRFVATQQAPSELVGRVTLWLAPAGWRLPGHRVTTWFLAALNWSVDSVKARLDDPLLAPPSPPELQIATLSLCMRGEGARLLAWLRAPGRAPAMGIVAAGVGMFVGETIDEPQEVAEVAQDIAFDLRWAHALYATVTGADPLDTVSPASPQAPRQQRRGRATRASRGGGGRG